MARVTPGLEQFLEPSSELGGLRAGARIGLVAHPASVDSRARHLLDRAVSDPRLEVVRLFAPEHGFRGEAQDMERVDDGVDAPSGLPVVSLYGSDAGSLAPAPELLADLDAIVFDLQDVGSRYYTFVYTMSHVMEAAAGVGIPMVVLDRPNPIGGIAVEGPVLEPQFASFVGRYPIPVRHGMTCGEIARLFNEAFGVRCDLRVVAMGGWRRRMPFEETGLPWVAPSPNMPSIATARVYPGGCLVEGTNLSEGRGTTRPFELVGAPWLDGPALGAALEREGLIGTAFRPTSFRPMFHKYEGRSCSGIQVHVLDPQNHRPFAAYVMLLREARRLAPDSFDWRREPYEFESDRLAIDLLLGRAGLREMIESGSSLAEMEASWSSDLRAFMELRRRFLIYPL